MEKQIVRITALKENYRKFSLMFMGEQLIVGFGRDSGAQLSRNSDARLISGDINTGGSRANWYVFCTEGTVFELSVDAEFYRKNKNRIKTWKVEELQEFTLSKERSAAFLNAHRNLE